jgi:hypothetical protein
MNSAVQRNPGWRTRKSPLWLISWLKRTLSHFHYVPLIVNIRISERCPQPQYSYVCKCYSELRSESLQLQSHEVMFWKFVAAVTFSHLALCWRSFGYTEVPAQSNANIGHKACSYPVRPCGSFLRLMSPVKPCKNPQF